MSKMKIVIALVAGAICGAAIPAALIWNDQAVIIGIVSGAVAAVAATITGLTVSKTS